MCTAHDLKTGTGIERQGPSRSGAVSLSKFQVLLGAAISRFSGRQLQFVCIQFNSSVLDPTHAASDIYHMRENFVAADLDKAWFGYLF